MAKYPRPIMFITMCLFGLIGVLAAGVELPSSVMVLFRGLIGSLFIVLVMLLTGSRLSKEDVRSNLKMLLLSGMFLGLNWLALFEAYKQTTISLATLANYMAPVFVMIVSPFLLGERFTLSKLICVILSILGLAMASGVIQQGMSGSSDIYGISLGLLAALCYCGMVMCNKRLGTIGACDRTLMQLSAATLILLAYCLVTVDFGSLSFTAEDIVRLIALGVITTGCTFLMYFGTMRYLPAQTTAIYGYMEPVVTLSLSALLLGEQLGVTGWIGALLILGSTLVCGSLDRDSDPIPEGS